MFTGIKEKLGANITEPPGLLNIRQLRLVTLFTAVSTPEMREEMLDEFRRRDTILRLVIASSAFGLGVDIPDISRIINWGLPHSLEDLVQETGRAGQNVSQAQAILYYKNMPRTSLCVVGTYYFIYSSCQCCDLCSPMCQCLHCINN